MPLGSMLIGVGSGVANALIGSSASKRAASAQQAAAQAAAMQYERAWNRASEALGPFSNVGRGAMLSLGQLYGIQPDGSYNFNNAMGQAALDAFRRSPDYAFAASEGMRNLVNSNSASGLLRSSDHLRSAINFNQGMATQTFGNYQTNLRNIGLMGLDASKGLASAAMGIGTGSANAQTAAGNAQAAGIMGSANSLMSGVNSVASSLAGYNAYTRNNSAYSQPSIYEAYTQSSPYMDGRALPQSYGNLPMPVYGSTPYNFNL